MPNINLRPWREELRKEKQQQFVLVLLLIAVMSGAIVFTWMQNVSGQIDFQRQRNSFLQKEIATQNKQIEEIKTLREERKTLIERMRVIQSLQGDRPIIVRVFDELVRTLPDGVYYTEVTKNGDLVHIRGTADKTNSISDLLRNLDGSEWFTDAFLADVKAEKDRSGNQIGNAFNITVKQTSPRAEEEAN